MLAIIVPPSRAPYFKLLPVEKDYLLLEGLDKKKRTFRIPDNHVTTATWPFSGFLAKWGAPVRMVVLLENLLDTPLSLILPELAEAETERVNRRIDTIKLAKIRRENIKSGMEPKDAAYEAAREIFQELVPNQEEFEDRLISFNQLPLRPVDSSLFLQNAVDQAVLEAGAQGVGMEQGGGNNGKNKNTVWFIVLLAVGIIGAGLTIYLLSNFDKLTKMFEKVMAAVGVS
jgi:hypothetical protein